MEELVVFWFRRDLRLDDNHGLFRALTAGYNVLPIFIFDPSILSRFPDPENRQVNYLINAVETLKQELVGCSSDLHIFHNSPLAVFQQLSEAYAVKAVFANEDYEPMAMLRDEEVRRFLGERSIGFHRFTDHLIRKPGAILKSDQTPYTIFTPFAKRWKQLLAVEDTQAFRVDLEVQNLLEFKVITPFDYRQLGYAFALESPRKVAIPTSIIAKYHETRDLPAITAGTSRLGVHLRFGTLSIRRLVASALVNETFLNELIWREFFMHILFHFPHVAAGSFRKQYDAIAWRNREDEFLDWCNGVTGVPLVDAGMRELNQTGLMHNRVRMVVASFLTKQLLIDWRWGEAYFAQKLLDFELSSNNGNWQWAAGCGCDAAPYFRIFNPVRQQERFDPKFEYIARWVPEYSTDAYRKLLKIDFGEAKERCLATYKRAIKGD